MDLETVTSYGFLFFGLGFFVFIIFWSARESNNSENMWYQRHVMESREFGFREPLPKKGRFRRRRH